jgi:DNA adenine methylase
MISYIGGKSKISNWIIPFIPKDIKTYVEPFGGMFWVYYKMNLKDYSNLNTIVYNDFNSLNANLFNCVKDYNRLHEMMSTYPTQKMGEDIDPKEYIECFNRCQQEVFNPSFVSPNNGNFDVACKYLYTLTHIFSGGKPGTSKFIYYHGKYRDKFLVFMDKLKKKEWQEHFDKINHVENMDACEVITKYDNEDAFFYIDPPYFATENYYSNHDFGLKDHERLANCMKQMKGKFALSYYDFPQLSEWYPKDQYRWESKEFPKSAAASKDKPQNKGLEILIMNY